MFLTSVADHAHGWRGEDEDASAEEGQFPQHHDLLPKEADELGHTACRVGDLVQRDSYTETYKVIMCKKKRNTLIFS